jgi:hypothetical protein
LGIDVAVVAPGSRIAFTVAVAIAIDKLGDILVGACPTFQDGKAVFDSNQDLLSRITALDVRGDSYRLV